MVEGAEGAAEAAADDGADHGDDLIWIENLSNMEMFDFFNHKLDLIRHRRQTVSKVPVLNLHF